MFEVVVIEHARIRLLARIFIVIGEYELCKRPRKRRGALTARLLLLARGKRREIFAHARKEILRPCKKADQCPFFLRRVAPCGTVHDRRKLCGCRLHVKQAARLCDLRELIFQ